MPFFPDENEERGDGNDIRRHEWNSDRVNQQRQQSFPSPRREIAAPYLIDSQLLEKKATGSKTSQPGLYSWGIWERVPTGP